MFIRGSVVRYVHLPGASVDTALLEDATRRGEKALPGGHGITMADCFYASQRQHNKHQSPDDRYELYDRDYEIDGNERGLNIRQLEA